MKKENNAAVLTLLTDANLTSFFIDDATPLCNFEFWKKKVLLLTKDFFSHVFTVGSFFTSCVKNGT